MAPKIVAVANTKGGCGKTTIALQLATALAHQGKDVWFIDSDSQQTGSMALTLRATQPGGFPFISCASFCNGTLLGGQVRGQAEKWDAVIIDIGGFDSMALRMALAVSDAVIIPFQPRTFDTWALNQMNKLLDDVLKLREGRSLPAYAVINAADTGNSADNRDAQEALEDFPKIKLFDCMIGRRKAFANASGLGLGVAEMKVKDPKAIGEINRLVRAIFGDESEKPAEESSEEPTEVETKPAKKTTKPAAKKSPAKKPAAKKAVAKKTTKRTAKKAEAAE